MSKLWSKHSRKPTDLAQRVEAFTVGNDYLLDEELLIYDIEASIAHAKGLHHIGVLTEQELDDLMKSLSEIEQLYQDGKFQIEQRHEDGHTAIEEYLTNKLGDTGKKIHTGRSRNDQVLTALRLYEKAKLEQLRVETTNLAQSLLHFAKKNEFVPMPGYTHTQPAMISSVGMWAGSFAEMLLNNIRLIRYVIELIDYCPLGTAAGFGVNLDLPREMISDLLGFRAPITSAMTAQASRGKWEATILHSLVSVGATLSQFAGDLIQYTSKEYGLISTSDEVTTGSSIMPQKRNQDVAELIRARHAQLVSDEFVLHQLTMRLTSGYHRDLQLTKEPVMRSFKNCLEMVSITHDLLAGLKVNLKSLKEKIYPEMLAADKANELVRKGVPFRDAYKQVADNLSDLNIDNLDNLLKDRKHLGATGNLGLDILEKELEVVKQL